MAGRGLKGESGKRPMLRGNIAKARKIWGELAANGDGRMRMNNLGVATRGKGTDPDVGRAINWFCKIGQGGQSVRHEQYGRMLEQGRGLPAPIRKRRPRWLDIAARKGAARGSVQSWLSV